MCVCESPICKFQSTLPHGERPIHAIHSQRTTRVSIHAACLLWYGPQGHGCAALAVRRTVQGRDVFDWLSHNSTQGHGKIPGRDMVNAGSRGHVACWRGNGYGGDAWAPPQGRAALRRQVRPITGGNGDVPGSIHQKTGFRSDAPAAEGRGHRHRTGESDGGPLSGSGLHLFRYGVGLSRQ